MATDVGTRIKRARERKRWSQRQLAEALKVDRKTVDNWENHRTSPRSSIGAIEEVLEVSLDREPEPDPYPNVPPDVEKWIRAYYRKDPEYIQRALDALEDALSPRPHPPSPGEAEPRRHQAG